jgi:peptide/nickel transport system substrate-binding protein
MVSPRTSRILTFALLATALVILAGCGAPATPTSTPAPVVPTKAPVAATQAPIAPAIAATATTVPATTAPTAAPTAAATAAATAASAASAATSAPATTAPTVAASTATTTTAASKAVQGGHVTIAMTNSPDTFCPINPNSSYGLFPAEVMYETLLKFNDKLEFQPRLASSWDISSDKTVFTFHLNPKAKWHDGTAVTASDVEWTIWIISHPKIATNRGNFISSIKGLDGTKRKEGVDTVEGVKVVDPQTIQFTLKAAVDPLQFLEQIGRNVFIIPKHLTKDIPVDKFLTDTFWTKPVGAGPFKFSRYQTDQFIEFKRNDDYYLGKANLDTLIISIVTPATMVAQLEKGELDMVAAGGIGDILIDDWEKVNALKNVTAISYPADGYQYMIVRGDKNKPWGNKLVRQALAYGLNRKLMVDQLIKGQGMVANGPVIPVTSYYDKSVESAYPYNVAKAKDLLKQANFDFSYVGTFIVPTGNTIRERSGDIILANLTDLGIKVNVQKMDFTSAMSKYKSGDYDLALVGWSGTLDPDVRSQFVTGREYNFSGMTIKSIDDVLEKAAVTSDTTQRKALYSDFQKTFVDEMPIIPLYWQNRLAAVSKRVVGAQHMVLTNNLLRNLNEWYVTDGK